SPKDGDSDSVVGSSPTDKEKAIANALADYFDRSACEESVDIDAFCKSYPGLEQDLLPLLHVLTEMDGDLTSLEAAAPAATDDPLPDRLSGHKILGEIGAGGMGRVLLAHDEGLNRKIAIKTLSERLRQNPSIRARFMQEAQALAQVSHPHIVTVYSLGPAEEIPHFVMEHVHGVDLFTASRPLALEQRVILLRHVVLAVEVLHQHHLIHRDLKPANILVGA